MIKMIASDLDGTLLQNGAQELRPELFPLIRELKKMGILFVAASGRQYSNIRRLFAPVAQEIGYICENGGVAAYQGEILYKDTVASELAREIMQAAWEKEGTEMTISGLETYYLCPKTKKYLDFVENVLHFQYQLVDESFCLPEPCVKLAVYEEAGAEKSLKFWQERFGDKCKVVTSGFAWIDFVPLETNKGKGMRKMMEKLGISPDECIAFGDEYNDIELLQSVKYSFAMEKSKEGVKAAATGIVGQVEPFLERFIHKKGNIEEVLA